MDAVLTATPAKPTATSWIMIAALGVTWGATFMGIELALEGFTPLWLAALRLLLAACVIWSVVAIMPSDPPKQDGRSRWPFLLFVGAVGAALPFFLLSWGQTHVTSAAAGVSMAMIALIVLPLSHVFVPGEVMTRRKTIGVLLGLAGVITLFSDRLGAGPDGWSGVAGQAACIGGAACYAMASIATRLCPPIDPLRLAAWQLTVGALLVLPFAIWIDGGPDLPDARPLIALAVLALVPTAGANILRVLVIRSAGPQFMSLTNFQVPVWSVIFGATLLSEPVPPQLGLALALILLGIGVTQAASLGRLFKDRD